MGAAEGGRATPQIAAATHPAPEGVPAFAVMARENSPRGPAGEENPPSGTLARAGIPRRSEPRRESVNGRCRSPSMGRDAPESCRAGNDDRNARPSAHSIAELRRQPAGQRRRIFRSMRAAARRCRRSRRPRSPRAGSRARRCGDREPPLRPGRSRPAGGANGRRAARRSEACDQQRGGDLVA